MRPRQRGQTGAAAPRLHVVPWRLSVPEHEHNGRRNKPDLYITNRAAWRREHEDWFAKQLRTAPPLTTAQRERLAAIIGPALVAPLGAAA
jgi:hypothetical protein